MKSSVSTPLEEKVTRNKAIPGVAHERKLEITAERGLAKNLLILVNGMIAARCDTE
jgi:hypothetical protein